MNKIAIDICFMLSNMILYDTRVAQEILKNENKIVENVMIIDQFFMNFEVNLCLKINLV